MEGSKRREEIIQLLSATAKPMTGADLAKQCDVSRQVVVQDIALIRAQGVKVTSTARGYIITDPKSNTAKRVFCLNHPADAMEEELFTIVDNGGHIMNIIVEHQIYGEITADLHLATRRQVEAFIKETKTHEFVPLMSLTGGEHYHTVEADSEDILDDIEAELKEKGFLVSAHR